MNKTIDGKPRKATKSGQRPLFKGCSSSNVRHSEKLPRFTRVVNIISSSISPRKGASFDPVYSLEGAYLDHFPFFGGPPPAPAGSYG